MDVYISHFAKADMFCDGRRCQPRQQRQWHEKGPVVFSSVSICFPRGFSSAVVGVGVVEVNRAG